MKINWPRGKYNGQRIVGVEAKFILNVTYWRWRPIRVRYAGGLHWLCFLTFWQWKYASTPKRERPGP